MDCGRPYQLKWNHVAWRVYWGKNGLDTNKCISYQLLSQRRLSKNQQPLINTSVSDS